MHKKNKAVRLPVLEDLTARLKARLPELAWYVNKIDPIALKRLPKGIFQEQDELSFDACFQEIEAHIERLVSVTNERSQYFLAQKIDEKINILVSFCHYFSKEDVSAKAMFQVKELKRYHDWMGDVRMKTNQLLSQKEALLRQLDLINEADSLKKLELLKQIGLIEVALTKSNEWLLQEANIV